MKPFASLSHRQTYVTRKSGFVIIPNASINDQPLTLCWKKEIQKKMQPRDPLQLLLRTASWHPHSFPPLTQQMHWRFTAPFAQMSTYTPLCRDRYDRFTRPILAQETSTLFPWSSKNATFRFRWFQLVPQTSHGQMNFEDLKMFQPPLYHVWRHLKPAFPKWLRSHLVPLLGRRIDQLLCQNAHRSRSVSASSKAQWETTFCKVINAFAPCSRRSTNCCHKSACFELFLTAPPIKIRFALLRTAWQSLHILMGWCRWTAKRIETRTAVSSALNAVCCCPLRCPHCTTTLSTMVWGHAAVIAHEATRNLWSLGNIQLPSVKTSSVTAAGSTAASMDTSGNWFNKTTNLIQLGGVTGQPWLSKQGGNLSKLSNHGNPLLACANAGQCHTRCWKESMAWQNVHLLLLLLSCLSLWTSVYKVPSRLLLKYAWSHAPKRLSATASSSRSVWLIPWNEARWATAHWRVCGQDHFSLWYSCSSEALKISIRPKTSLKVPSRWSCQPNCESLWVSKKVGPLRGTSGACTATSCNIPLNWSIWPNSRHSRNDW